MSGARSYHAGRVAEEAVARHYEGAGCRVAARRWRGRGGEIDLILRAPDTLVFVEVKQSATHGRAAGHLSPRQIGRILSAAAEYLGGEPGGQDTAMRIDVALVDGQGRVEILENAVTA